MINVRIKRVLIYWNNSSHSILSSLFFFFTFSLIYCCSVSQINEIHASSSLNNTYHPVERAFTTIQYDFLTKTETLGDERSIIITIETSVPPFSGGLDSNIRLSYPLPLDDRVQINITSSFPWSTICKLYITAADDSLWIDSGAIINEFHVLTCGHW